MTEAVHLSVRLRNKIYDSPLINQRVITYLMRYASPRPYSWQHVSSSPKDPGFSHSLKPCSHHRAASIFARHHRFYNAISCFKTLASSTNSGLAYQTSHTQPSDSKNQCNNLHWWQLLARFWFLDQHSMWTIMVFITYSSNLSEKSILIYKVRGTGSHTLSKKICCSLILQIKWKFRCCNALTIVEDKL